MSYTSYGYNFEDSPSGLIVPVVTSPGAVDGIVDVAFDINLPGGTSTFLRGDGTFAVPTGGGLSTKLYDFTISGSDQASIDTFVDGTTVANFTGYDVLEVWIIARTDDAAAQAAVDITVNNDTGGNYDRQVLDATNATVSAGVALAQTKWSSNAHGSGGTAGYAEFVQITIPGYAATTFNKVGMMLESRIDGTAGNNSADVVPIGWRNTAAITRMKVAAQGAAKLKVGSRLMVFAR